MRGKLVIRRRAAGLSRRALSPVAAGPIASERRPELANARAERAAELRQPPRAEDEQQDDEHERKVRRADQSRAHQRRTTLRAVIPRVAPRKSTTSGAASTTAWRSTPGWCVITTATSQPSTTASSGAEESPNCGSEGTCSS